MPGILKLQKLNSDLHSAQTFNINVLHFYGNIYRSIFVPQYIPFPEPTFLAKLHSSLPSKWHRFSGGKILTRDLSWFHLNPNPLPIHKGLQRHRVMYLGSSNQVQILVRLQLTWFLTNFNNKILQKFIHWEQLLHTRKLVLIAG
jgi:hypothetical protein